MYNKVSLFHVALSFMLTTFGSMEGMAQGAAVSPSRIFFSGNPGQTLHQLVEVSNTSTKPLLFNISIKDWERDSVGNKVYHEPGTLSASNANWLEVNSQTIEIPPGATKSVDIMMHVPSGENTKPQVTNSMVFFTQVVEQRPVTEVTQGSGVGINIQLEFGVHVYHTPTGFSRKELDFVEFNELTVNGDENKRAVAVKIKNTGEVVTDAYLRFEMTNKATGEELKIDPLSISMMPFDEQLVQLSLPADIKGKFLIVAILDYGAGTNLKIAEKEVVYE
ncbi:hypothetical protein [Parapedobacter tibetensis]|uniref:hypothetical protein n=1 Tax=Parapedobacter tibetensis TaxID=2972951 RepID=UPI00214D74D9|nr:hypothetical protein [Parapedobacter tibetensis]